jgi:anti-anti-sigma regulatory factor
VIASSNGSAANSTFRYGNPTVDCGGAQLRAQCRHLATVVSITGDVTDANIDALIERVRHYILTEKPIVLDLGDVRSFAADGIALLEAVDDMCDEAAVEWSLVASQSVLRVLRLRGDEDVVPTADSVPEALHHFSDVMSERRQLLPILGKSA